MKEIPEYVMDSDEDMNQIDEAPIKQAKKQLSIKRSDKINATYSFTNEDHTLGNLLRSTLVKSNKVEFCAYSVPHPSEPLMNVRLQVHESTDTNTVLKHGLKRIVKECDVLTEKFKEALVESGVRGMEV